MRLIHALKGRTSTSASSTAFSLGCDATSHGVLPAGCSCCYICVHHCHLVQVTLLVHCLCVGQVVVSLTFTVMQTSLGPCPPAREVCPYKGCPVNQGLMCSNQGHCFDGKCYCAVDRSGPACEFPLCDTDDECLDGQFCSDDHECSGGVAPPPTPPAPFSGVTAVRCCPKASHCMASAVLGNCPESYFVAKWL